MINSTISKFKDKNKYQLIDNQIKLYLDIKSVFKIIILHHQLPNTS